VHRAERHRSRAPGSPLADYSLFGGDGTVGPAGIVGVLVTLMVAGGLFWALRRRDTASRK